MFSRGTLDFLFENRLHDSKEWFDAHKDDYNRLVLAPLQEIVEALSPTMLGIDPQFVTTLRVDKTICRIRRDTRYTRDPSLYRDHMWIVFKRNRMHDTEYPGFYFEISGSGFGYGCGFYHASASYMDTMRRMILDNDASFRKAKRAYETQKVFTMDGESYKRSRYPDESPGRQLWLNRRNISFDAGSGDFELLFSDRLAEKVAADLVLLGPIYRFLLDVAGKEAQAAAANQRAQVHFDF